MLYRSPGIESHSMDRNRVAKKKLMTFPTEDDTDDTSLGLKSHFQTILFLSFLPSFLLITYRLLPFLAKPVCNLNFNIYSLLLK